MHSKSYNINVACFCSEDFTKSLEELKPFFGFNLVTSGISTNDLISNKFNALIIESDPKKKISLDNISVPKILIQKNKKVENSKGLFALIINLPLNFIQFNQDIIDVCKKYEFNKNSLVNIREYILDKNQRVLKKNNIILRLTEKEVIFLETLSSSKMALTRNYILENIWKYSSETDTHTVETHIYRLRQKIKDHFKDNDFIKNSSKGYSL